MIKEGSLEDRGCEQREGKKVMRRACEDKLLHCESLCMLLKTVLGIPSWIIGFATSKTLDSVGCVVYIDQVHACLSLSEIGLNV